VVHVCRGLSSGRRAARLARSARCLALWVPTQTAQRQPASYSELFPVAPCLTGQACQKGRGPAPLERGIERRGRCEVTRGAARAAGRVVGPVDLDECARIVDAFAVVTAVESGVDAGPARRWVRRFARSSPRGARNSSQSLRGLGRVTVEPSVGGRFRLLGRVYMFRRFDVVNQPRQARAALLGGNKTARGRGWPPGLIPPGCVRAADVP
jgi:hypothetical protein